MRQIHYALITVAAMTCIATTATAKDVKVSGITYSGNLTLPVLHPGDTVAVTVQPANLIDYSYTISLDKTEPLNQTMFPVVGVEPSLASERLQEVLEIPLAATAAAPDLPPGLLASYDRIAAKYDLVAVDVAKTTDAVEAAHATLNADLLASNGSWPSAFMASLDAFRLTAFGAVGSSACTNSSAICSRLSSLNADLDQLERSADRIAFTKAKATDPPTDVTITAFKSLIQALRVSVGKLVDRVEAARQRVDRWTRIIRSNPMPQVEQSFIVANESTRYTVHVKRTALDANGALPTATAAVETLAEIVFEGHALSRLLISTGIAALYKPNDVSFSIIGSVAPDKTRVFNVVRTQSSKTEMKPVVTIGVYTHPVDNFRHDLQEIRPFFCVGTEINASVKSYLVGGGFDTPFGLVLSVGLTNYSKTVLAPGWSEGQEVPKNSDGTAAIITTVPTKTRNAFGYYFSVQFRPAIFNKFLGFQKGS